MPASYYPDTLTVRLPPGSRDRVVAQAAASGQSPADWLRAVIRRAVESAERRRKAANREAAS